MNSIPETNEGLHRLGIVIGGIQRSGTSLIRAVIGSHPDIAFVQWDLPLWTHVYPVYRHRDLADPACLEALVEEVIEHPKARGADHRVPADQLCEAVAGKETLSVSDVFVEYLRLYAKVRGRPTWGLKTPGNEFWADQILGHWEGARFIHVVRDPRDVAVSYCSYGDGAWYYNAWSHVKRWNASSRIASVKQEEYRDRYLVVKYERFVQDPESGVRRLADFLDIEPYPAMLAMTGHPGWEGDNSYFDDTPNSRSDPPISSSPVGRYEDSLAGDLVWLYDSRCRRGMRRWGYELSRETVALHEKLRALLLLGISAGRGVVRAALRKIALWTRALLVGRTSGRWLRDILWPS